MKPWSMLILLAGLLFAGCGDGGGDKSNPAGGTSSGNPITAPVDYLGAVGKAQQSAGKTTASVGLTQAIKMFEAQEGRRPRTLEELVPEFMDRIPAPPAGMKFLYNPADGSLKVIPQ